MAKLRNTIVIRNIETGKDIRLSPKDYEEIQLAIEDDVTELVTEGVNFRNERLYKYYKSLNDKLKKVL